MENEQKRAEDLAGKMTANWYRTSGGLIAALTPYALALLTARQALDRLQFTNSHSGHGPHCTCSQGERERIASEALTKLNEAIG